MATQIRRTWIWIAVGLLFAVYAICPAQADEANTPSARAIERAEALKAAAESGTLKEYLEAREAAKVMSEAEVLFAAEMDAAEKAGLAHDRDAKVEHLRKALTLRPDHPKNLRVEFDIGIELSQRYPPRLTEAMVVFEHILATYTHMDYYSVEHNSLGNPMQFLMPRAGVQAACIARGPEQNPQKAQEYLLRAMEHMNETYLKRVEDWTTANDPLDQAIRPEVREIYYATTPMAKEKRQEREKIYAQRRIDAANGDVFGPREMDTVQAAVRQYGYSHGRHRPEVAIVVMREIIDRFPNTPMAKVAQGHIDKALAMLDQERLDDLADKITYLPPPEPNAATQPATPSPAPSPTPPPGRDSQSNAQKPPGLAATITTSLRTHYYAWLAGTAAVVVAAGVVRYARKRRT